jgi:cell division protein FtsI/penicillin-binding protein 2
MLVQSAMGPLGSYGEASCALVPGYQVAAKTGTAEIVEQGTGYKTGPGSTIASTIAYAPAFHPRFSVLVVIRKPRIDWSNSQWGSETAAPIVHDIFSDLFLHYHIAPAAQNAARVLSSQTEFGGCVFEPH